MKSIDEIMQVEIFNAIAEHSGFFAGQAKPFLPDAMRRVQQAIKDNHYAIVPLDAVKDGVKLNELNQVENGND